MIFMNEYEIQDAEREYRSHAILGPATKTLLALADWTNRNSDGWAYWPKPCRAAAEAERNRKARRRPSRAEDERQSRAMEEAGIVREDFLRGVEADEEDRPF